MGQVLEDKPGPLVATTWTSDYALDPPLLVCMIYVCQFNMGPAQVTLRGLTLHAHPAVNTAWFPVRWSISRSRLPKTLRTSVHYQENAAHPRWNLLLAVSSPLMEERSPLFMITNRRWIGRFSVEYPVYFDDYSALLA